MVFEEKEQLVRVVSQIGNGAHIFAPKEWINEKVLLVRIEKKTIKEQILGKLFPFLDKIIAVFLYGSYARGEAEESSDLDVLVIAREKFKIENAKEFIILKEEEIPRAIKLNPILMYSIIKESQAIINQKYLENLGEIKIDRKNFKNFLEQTSQAIKSNEEVIELDKKTGIYCSDSVIYSGILRLRGVFIINCLFDGETYSNVSFKKFLSKRDILFNEVYAVYRQVREGKFGKDTKILIEQEERLINLLKEELNNLKERLK